MSFQSGSILLDKGVVRRVYEARVRLALGQPPTLHQAEAANVWSRLRAFNIPLYITEQTEHVLRRRSPLFAMTLLAQTRALKKGRYLRRWARRLRDVGFSPEDATMPETYEVLIDYLAHEKPGIRNLAAWHLVRLVPQGKSIPFQPDGTAEDAAKCVVAWKKLIPSGQLPPRVKKE